MSYTVVLSKPALRALQGLQLTINQRLASSIDELKEDPRPKGCKKLKGKSALWRIRVGDYRVIYSIDDVVLVVEILRIGHRGDIYK